MYKKVRKNSETDIIFYSDTSFPSAAMLYCCDLVVWDYHGRWHCLPSHHDTVVMFTLHQM